MNETENIIHRPANIDEYICNFDLKTRVKAHMIAADKKGDLFPHTLLTGPAGTGKTSLAEIIAKSMETCIIKFVGQELRSKEQLSVLLSVPPRGAVVFIDEIHSVSKQVMEMMYPIMEDGRMSSVGDPTLKLYLSKLCVIGATTEPGSLEKPLIDRFTLKFNMQPYSEKQMILIVKGMAKYARKNYSDDAIIDIARRSKATPRVAGSLLFQVNDFAISKELDLIDDVPNTLVDLQYIVRLSLDHYSTA